MLSLIARERKNYFNNFFTASIIVVEGTAHEIRIYSPVFILSNTFAGVPLIWNTRDQKSICVYTKSLSLGSDMQLV